MAKYVARYVLPYEHIVEVGIKAGSAAAATKKAREHFNNGTLWDNTERVPLLRDTVEEKNNGDHGVVLEFEAQKVKEYPQPHPGVAIKAMRAAAERLVMEIASLSKNGQKTHADVRNTLLSLIDKAREVRTYRHGMWQPAADVFPRDMPSFAVFESLQNGITRYPRIPENKWVRYAPGDIEDPVFMD